MLAALLAALFATLTGAVGALPAAGAPATGSSGPPVPSGAQPHKLSPHVYPGGGLAAFGDASLTDPQMPASVNSPIVAAAASPSGNGVWLAGADGGVYALGDATFYGSTGDLQLQGPVVGMAATPDGGGYWLVALDGGIFAFGDAHFYGSMGGRPLNEPIVGMAATPDGGGYWLVAADGGIFAFGDARFYGSTGALALNAPIVGMAATKDGGGYWLVAADGGIFCFGDATFHGSEGGQSLTAWVVGMIPTPDDLGYTMAGADGSIYTFGDAVNHGSAASGDGAATPVSAIIGAPGGGGYWLLQPDDWAVNFSNPPPNGTFPGSSAIVAAAASQVQPDPDTGYFCNPYGPCEAWCALFATWAMQQGGVPIPSYAFVGDVYYWGLDNGTVLPGTATPVPGDAILYGTGPQDVETSVHMGIVAQVWPDGAIVTVEGDAGPGQAGWLAVWMNGPFLPMDSDWYNGFGVYAYVQP